MRFITLIQRLSYMILHLRTSRYQKHYIILTILFTLICCDGKIIRVQNLDFKVNGNPSSLKLRDNVDENTKKVLTIDKAKCDIKQHNNETVTPKIGNETETRRKGVKYEDMTIQDKIKNIQSEINRSKPFSRTIESLERLTKIRLLLEDIKVLLKKETEKYKYKDEFKEYVPFSDDIRHTDFIAQKKPEILKDGLALIPGL